MKKRMMILCLAIFMLLSLAGCQLSAEDQITKSLLKWQQIKTMDAEVEFMLKTEVMGEKIAMNMDMDIAFDGGRQKSMTELTIAMSQMTQSIKTYSEQLKDGRITAVMDAGSGWIEQEITEQHEGFAPDYNIEKAVELYLENIKNFEDAGMEEFNGQKARKITGALTGDSLKSALELSADAMGNTMGDIMDEQVLQALQDVPIVLWIDPQSHYIVKIDVDLKDALSALMDNMLQDAIALGLTVNFGACHMTMTVNTINSDAFDFNRIQKPSAN